MACPLDVHWMPRVWVMEKSGRMFLDSCLASNVDSFIQHNLHLLMPSSRATSGSLLTNAATTLINFFFLLRQLQGS
ncbi:hypothetical protein RO3G_16102 [Rhizopus delemar RA 99-880]|uniref:Uncharacterized protein n=1 Tax=Rhizopus delemar (strain RA 99-880 / ATCC MYA-4621 / FGSC 9543 / NRRL 43880) TaxID=246409 RepID=I1CSG1_RHIO9|nr:hypothetical protein RO3G_16102 [Rhizopus delemar RA 99-880]|eukprot:EIE91391.1 hypothetical protein RO3G_16102 [Rhizopus delemar RA 99-880]